VYYLFVVYLHGRVVSVPNFGIMKIRVAHVSGQIIKYQWRRVTTARRVAKSRIQAFRK
jgi:hypothetical protein